MLHRALLDPTPPADTDADTVASAEASRDIERDERRREMLTELAEISMRLARSLGDLVEARVEQEKTSKDAPAHSKDAAAAFDKMAQTVRRTLALEAKLAEGVKARREKLITDGAERRATRAAAHKDNVDEAIMEGLHDAYAADCSEDEYHTLAERLLDDAREYLGDADEMRGYLDRPVGETVAKLCAAMGLDPEACEPDGETWRIRRPPLDFELRIEERARKYGASSSSLPRSGEGQDAKHPGWGALSASANARDYPTQPHPDGFAVCPSP
jgi:hypothetical protein